MSSDRYRYYIDGRVSLYGYPTVQEIANAIHDVMDFTNYTILPGRVFVYDSGHDAVDRWAEVSYDLAINSLVLTPCDRPEGLEH